MLIRMRKSMTNQKGFTLIELMVVIAIIGILAAIAIPKFASANDTARGAKMAADLRTIDSAVSIVIAQGGTPTVTAGTPPTGTVPALLATWPVPPVGAYKAVTTGTAAPATAYTLDTAANNYRALCGIYHAETI